MVRRGSEAAAGPAVLVALAFVVTGCSLAPDYRRPAAPVPTNFTGEEDASRPSIAQRDWREFFKDPDLQRLIEEALTQNRDLRVATARLNEARAAYRIEGSALYPEVGASGSYSRTTNSSDTPEDLGEVEVPDDLVIEQLSAQLSARWEIDFWGRVANLREAALEQYLASAEARRAVATQLIAQVANGYLLEREYAERIILAETALDTRQKTLHLARRRYELGSDSRLQVVQAQLLLGQAEQALHQLRMDRQVNRHALALLVGHPVTLEPRPLALEALEEEAALPAGLPSELLLNRPDIAAAERRLRAANANIGAARAAYFPSISLTGSAGYSSLEIEDLLESEGGYSWNFQPQINLPIFDGGARKGRLEAARARYDAAIAEYEQTIQEGFRDVSDALVRRRQLAAQRDTLREMVEVLDERVRLAQLRYDSGRSAYLEVLDAERERFDTEQELVRVTRAYLASGVALYTALGGGFAGQDPLLAPEEVGESAS